MKKIKILLIEDNRLLREGITAILKKQSDMQVVATVGNGENISVLMERYKVNIVLLDIGLRDKNSLQLVKLIKRSFPETAIIVMDLLPLQTDVFEYVQEGADGFIIKDASVADFYKTIRMIHKGIQVLPSILAGTLFSQIVEQTIHEVQPSVIAKSVRMTKREKEVIKLIADGCTNKEIAIELHLSPYTVKSHVHNILEKLALNTRVQIAKQVHLSDGYKTANNTSQK